MTKIYANIVYALLWLVSLLPFRAIYLLSDLLAGLLHSVIRYRRRVVRENLASSFPERPEKELRKIERRFYRFLTDYALETIKLITMRPATIKKRMRLVNIDTVNDATGRGRSVSLLLGHYCNWEWVSSIPLQLENGAIGAQIYHFLHSRVMDDVFKRIRTRFGAENIPMQKIMRRLVEWKREGTVTVTGYIADQEPGFDVHLYLDFLNHETAVYTGPERISRFLDAEVYYCRLLRPRRGYYTLEFVPVTLTPKKEPVFSITREYFRMLEESIDAHPEYWLWSHKRWKRPREVFYEHWGEEKAREMLTHL